MVKISLQMKATLENVEELYTSHQTYSYSLKVKCLNCGEASDKWHDVSESETFPTKTGKSETNFYSKCKLCGRENSMDIIQGSNGRYLADDQGAFKGVLSFDCRGLEPIEFSPGQGWIAKAEGSGKTFEDVDLSEKEWVDYDEKTKQSVGVYEFESQFVKIK